MTGQGSSARILVHDKGHQISSMYTFGNDYAFTTFPDNASLVNLFEIQMEDVTYLKDKRTPCQSEPRTEDMNTCIQHYLERTMKCQLPWHNESTVLPRCTKPEQYDEFIKSYNKITRMKEASIAEITSCLPSCERREFQMKLITSKTIPLTDGQRHITGYFYYPNGRYTEKHHYYTYKTGDLFADIGGYLGLLLGYSILSCYDAFRYLCKKMPTF